MPVVAAFLAGVIGAAILWPRLAPTLRRPVFLRENYRQASLPTAGGIVIIVVAVAVESGITLADALGVDIALATIEARRLVIAAVVGFGFLGLLDDLGANGESGGFRGHLRALIAGQLTTGAIKLFGGAALGMIAVAGYGERSIGWVLADGALVALSANLGNLFDRAPGRTIKVSLLVFVALALVSGFGQPLVGVAVVAGAAAGLLVPDLREQLMLGDTGANVLGAALGLGVAFTIGPGARLGVLAVVAILNAASELVSFTQVIERVPPLRALDRLGRRPSPL